MSTTDWLERSARLDPDRVFLETQDATRSFGEMDRESARLAASLARQGIEPSSVVGLWATNTLDTVRSMFAINRAGAAIQLLNTRLTSDELDAQLTATKAVGVLGSDQPLASPALDASLADGQLRMTLADSDVAVVAFTSGTSGEPKGVNLTQGNLGAAVCGSVEHLDHQPSDSWLCALPLFHVGGASIIWRSSYVGSRVLLRQTFDPQVFSADLRRVTLASVVGAMLDPILTSDPGPYDGVRAVLVGGGATPPRLMERAWEAGIPVLSTYGMTETASQMATAPLDKPPRRRVQALPGVNLRVREGEIQVSGAMVADTYIDGTSTLTSDGWLPTGDVGVFEDGMLTVTGRRRDIIVTGGENVSPSEVEAAISDIAGVSDCAVVGVSDERWGEAVTAAIVTTESAANIEAALREVLADFKVPKHWSLVDEIPRNAIGKVDRDAVRALVHRG